MQLSRIIAAGCHFLILCMTLFAEQTTELASAADRPNFLVIIADDLGFSDAGCYGGEIATPNLDALAAGGLRFTQFYNTARCWPTRSALMTGYYPQQIGRDKLPGAPKQFGVRGTRPAWARTIAEHLRPVGYRTYHSGKWHIDGNPTDHGFDLSNPTTRGPGFFEGLGKTDRDPNYYQTIDTAEHAIACLRQHAAEYKDQPFFQYVAFHAPHFPLHALPQDIAKYEQRYQQGWDKLREERHERQKRLGIEVAELSPLEPNLGPPYAFPEQIALLGPGEINRPIPWQELNPTQQAFQANKMAIHAAMVDRMDQEIGRIVEQLRQMQVLENTFICFLSDNGASAEIMVRGDGHDPNAAMGSAATYLCLGPGFSSVANTPFRRHKTWVHEGGISTPFIVHWPSGIQDRNVVRSTVAHVIDIAPTIFDLADVPVLPTSGPPLSGKSLRSVLQQDDSPVHDELWFYHEGNRALRQSDWKIVSATNAGLLANVEPDGSSDRPQANGEGNADGVWRLYNLNSDRAEQHDLADRHPERVAAMAQRWEELRLQFLHDATGDTEGQKP